jgi:hypothetical protein
MYGGLDEVKQQSDSAECADDDAADPEDFH